MGLILCLNKHEYIHVVRLGWDGCVTNTVQYAFLLSMVMDICVVVLVGANVVGEKG